MGHDVTTIGNHKLNIQDTESLAKDISVRFKSNVTYGYADQIWIDLNGNLAEPTFKNIVLGEVHYPGSQQTIWLSDELYRIHQLLQKYGSQYVNLPVLKNENSFQYDFDTALKGVSYEFMDIENQIDYGRIDKDTFHNFNSQFCRRWWYFIRNFMEPDDRFDVDINELNQYRKEIMELYQLVGGTAVVHISDSGKTEYLTNGDQTWQEILDELNSNFKDSTINISEFINQKQPLWPKDKYPQAFYDDFEDLK